jgi:hypothetical protein
VCHWGEASARLGLGFAGAVGETGAEKGGFWSMYPGERVAVTRLGSEKGNIFCEISRWRYGFSYSVSESSLRSVTTLSSEFFPLLFKSIEIFQLPAFLWAATATDSYSHRFRQGPIGQVLRRRKKRGTWRCWEIRYRGIYLLVGSYKALVACTGTCTCTCTTQRAQAFIYWFYMSVDDVL